jgi:hypothetical protein
VKQLKKSSFEAKLIKLCDISANLRDFTLSSKTKKIRNIKREIFYLNVIKSDIIKNKSQFPGIISLVNGINDVIKAHGLRPIIL